MKKKLRQYHFKSASQWNACLFLHADRDALRANGVVQPFPPYSLDAIRYESPGGRAPAALRSGEMMWCDDQNFLNRAFDAGAASGAVIDTILAPQSIACANRIVAKAGDVWVAGVARTSLESYDEASLTRRITVELPDARVIDIAAGERDTVLALVECGATLLCKMVSCAGHVIKTVVFECISHVRAFTFLQRSKQFVVLAGEDHPCLYWFSLQGGSCLFSKPIAALRPNFAPGEFGSDASERIILAGVEQGPRQQRPIDIVLMFDAGGVLLAATPIDPRDAPVTGVVATRRSLLVAGARGLLQYTATDVVPYETDGIGADEVQCMVVTPMLTSLNPEGTTSWLRVEASSTLPGGTTLEIACAAATFKDDVGLRDKLNGIAQNNRLPESHRIREMMQIDDTWQTLAVFKGDDSDGQSATMICPAPLFAVDKPYVWVRVTMTAARGARLPALSELAVLYPGHSLVEHLPMPYRRDSALRTIPQPDNFLRSLVGVFEATTQEIDARIASLGSLVHPSSAPEPWLDYVARWLGVPWNDALGEDQKRAILSHAAELAKGRGTRAGLETLLECLLPGPPRRFRVIDGLADYGFAVVGGQRCQGSVLPAMLGSFSRDNAALDSAAILGQMRLPCAGQSGQSSKPIAGKVIVQLAARADEREKWKLWLHAFIAEMTPLTTHVELHWVSTRALRGQRLDGAFKLQAPPDPTLDTDAVTGLVRLPEPRRTRLTRSGPTLATRLQ